MEKSVFSSRREALAGAMRAREPSSVALFPAAPVFTRNNDVEHEYRQDSDLHYLSGFDEPESVMVLGLGEAGPVTTLFVRPRDPDREIWDGPRAGVDGSVADFGANAAFPIGDLATELPKLLEDKKRLYYRVGRDRVFDDKVFAALDRIRARAKLGHGCPAEIVDPGVLVHEMRLFKGEAELACMRKAAKITEEAHVRAMSRARPGMLEYEIESLLLEAFRRNGAERPAYGSIVGSGPNATILHYRSNDRRMEAGELLLIDAGCEYGYYASDVTRTFPVSGTFSKEQRAIYELVLDAQLAGIEATRVGGTLDDIHNRCVDVLTSGLVRLGLLSGEKDELISSGAYKRFYMHRTSHWIGMDVHDVGAYHIDRVVRTLAPGMVLTVEPGIYIGRNDESVPAEWRGIGVRIEDDILVTASGHDNLTRTIPKTVAEVERACAS